MYASWEDHKDDYTVWRRFWALFELRRKWNWANWFYVQLDREKNNIVEPSAWSLFPGPNYMKLCLWVAFLRSVHEGMTKTLDSFDTPPKDKVEITEVLPKIPSSIMKFPAIKGSPFRDFRNAIFHCQWSPKLPKFDLDSKNTQDIEKLHTEIGCWLNSEFKTVFLDFKIKYPEYPLPWIFDSQGNEFMPDIFF